MAEVFLKAPDQVASLMTANSHKEKKETKYTMVTTTKSAADKIMGT